MLKVKTALKAGGVSVQHNRRVIRVASGIKAGGWCCVTNHSRRVLKVRSGIKAGGFCYCNHSRNLLK